MCLFALKNSLYERIGGAAAVSATVARLYEKILEDELLAPYFENVDIERLRISQSAFVTVAFGGVNHYTGQGIRNAHRRLLEKGLSDAHFDAVAKHLNDAMTELKVPSVLIKEALAIVENTRNDILDRS